MSDVETAAPAPDEAEALSAARAGYEAKTRGFQPPVDEPASPTPQATAESADDQSGGANGGSGDSKPAEEATQPAEPAASAPSVQDELTSLKEKVRSMEASGGASAQEIRRLHGEIGSLNRAIKSMSKTEPAGDELAAAISRAEKVAEEYPELGGPMVTALKLMSQRQAAQPAAEAPPAEQVNAPSEQNGYSQEQQQAIKAIDEVHPDRRQIKDSPEFKTWLSTKPAEYQQSFWTTWNPAVVSDCLTKFKTYREVEQTRAAQAEADRKRKQTRLEASVSPQGVPGRVQPQVLPDEAGFARGYARRKGLAA